MANVNCGACGHLNSRGYCNLTACIFPCSFGTGGYINKPMTNADRIRAMTDEELAAAICKIEQMTAKQGHRGFHAWLDWLKEEETH